MFRPKRDVVVGGWRKQHKEDLHNLSSSPSIIRMIKSRRMRWARHATLMGVKGNTYGIFVGNLEGNKPLGKPRSICEGNVRTVLKEVELGGMDWIDLT
ncbi:hypothetical protein B7P43_G07112 [Cryptotermes secundus]|uniref:Uncharacterized protein n=1 Tax=Cryptotermes secundus TaxID=105785 RepID=A0A2J7Q2A6_9NEOP|nr:hypothetical protein B7P43_G07112 [Cryptotermes secundus]